jgi:hypothetical protein
MSLTDLEGEGPGRQHERGCADGLPQQDAVAALCVRQHTLQSSLRPYQVAGSRAEEGKCQHRVGRALDPRDVQQPPDVQHKVLRTGLLSAQVKDHDGPSRSLLHWQLVFRHKRI